MIHTIHIDDLHYPLWLKEIPDPPQTLYAQGNLDLLKACPGIAMVGMRRCSKRGSTLAYRWSRELSRQGHVIISGLAFGIDAAAHQGALEGSGNTIAVIPSCLPEVTPKSHKGLAQKIINNGGLLISEWDLPRTIQKHDYLIRNRIVSGLSHAVVLIEAAVPSGALNTAHHALEQNRDVMVVPGHPNDIESQGCLTLLKKGATPVLSPTDILEELGLHSQVQTKNLLPEHLQAIYENIRASPKSASTFSSDERTKVSQLELLGSIQRDASGLYWAT